MMDNYLLKVKGIVSRAARRKLLSKTRYTNTDKLYCMLFFDKAAADIPTDTIFSFLIDPDWPEVPMPIKATIKMVTQAAGVMLEEIPQGQRTVCDVLFDKASFELINSKLPVTESWYDKTDKDYWLSTASTPDFPNK